jgi:signal transduction histidine kinase
MRTIPSFESIEAQSLRRQQIAFSILTLFVIAILLLLHALFARLLGQPSKAMIIVLAAGFLAKTWEVMWLQEQREGISAKVAQTETMISVFGIFVLAGILPLLTNRDDPPYFILLAIPILQCAYNFGLFSTIATIVASIAMMFAWVHNYFSLRPPVRPSEYLETGMIAAMFCFTGPLVWYLVYQLRGRENVLREKVAELDRTREKLIAEEKLAAIGRLASGVAHEIRNPVAMIASALATASFPASDAREREEMYGIAAREARRLENLTTDFLTYARPSLPQRTLVSLTEITRHIADVAGMRATDRGIAVRCQADEENCAEVDAAQIEAALLNLALNALDATPAGGQIELRIRRDDGDLCIDVENSGEPIPDAFLSKVFEPFFTTKPDGTGLGLAIARRIALAHGGHLRVSSNRAGAVVFTLTLRAHSSAVSTEEALYGEGSGH